VRFAGTEARAAAVLVPQVVVRVPVSIAPTAMPPVPPPEVAGGGERTIRNRSSAWRSAATAGLVGALLSILPFGFLLAFPLAGFLSVLFYRRRTWGVELSPSAGLRLGLRTGMLAFAMFLVLGGLMIVASHSEGQIQQTMIDAVHGQQARSPDPHDRQMLDYLLTPNGLALLIIACLIFIGIAVVLLAGLGGAVSASLLRRKPPEN